MSDNGSKKTVEPNRTTAAMPQTHKFSEAEKQMRFEMITARTDKPRPQPQYTPEVLRKLPSKAYFEDGWNVAKVLPGRLFGKLDDEEYCLNELREELKVAAWGSKHRRWMKIQDEIAKLDPELAKDTRGINIVVPTLMSSDDETPFKTNMVILNNDQDCLRIAKNHVKKQPNFSSILFQSLISTTDNDHWKKQRSFMNEIFLPKMSLAKIFPISLERAKVCADRLEGIRRNPKKPEYGVQMHEFYMYEAQAQLQLALFGMDTEYMERSNASIRDAFNGNPRPNEGVGYWCFDMMKQVGKNSAFAAVSDPEVISGEKKLFGPLSKNVDNLSSTMNMNVRDQFGNMFLILFAGHDTTGHTMTFLTYELAKHPEYQKRLHDEVDKFYEMLNGRDMTYEDLDHLPFLTRCVMETLRLHAAVANGSFRELQYDDYVTGPGGKPTLLKKGTFVQVVNQIRHRNPSYWGDDSNEFNPDREFRDDEIWGGETFKAFNPSSARFSPFTFAPRDCLGKNFAQMEMRTILANVFHRFSFELSDLYKNFDWEKYGHDIENFQGTLGPRDISPEGIKATAERMAARTGGPAGLAGGGPVNGLYMKVIPRKPRASL
eukprot:g6557.t1